MNVVCLMPTYGRSATLIKNAIACFNGQDYPQAKRRLLVYDDLGNFDKPSIVLPPEIVLLSTPKREPSLPAKYETMVDYASTMLPNFQPDMFVLWDDDDIYLPWHISQHVNTLQNHSNSFPNWSYPYYVWSLYTGKPRIELSGGRFWCSIAVSREAWKAAWDHTYTEMDYDQRFLKRLAQVDVASRPKGMPSFCMRWGSTKHTHCSSGSRTNWYADYQPQHTAPITTLVGQYDAETLKTIQLISSVTVNDIPKYI